jgi:hypothetical protein
MSLSEAQGTSFGGAEGNKIPPQNMALEQEVPSTINDSATAENPGKMAGILP